MFRRRRSAVELLAELENLIERARPVPTTDEIGLDERAALKLVRGLGATDEAVADPLLREAATRLAATIREARVIPLTGKRRLDESVLRAAPAELRALLERV